MLTFLYWLFSRVQAEPDVVEIKDSFLSKQGTASIVPYYHLVGREASFQKINTAVKREGYGARTYLRKDVYTIIQKIFMELKDEPHKIVYGEGSWGGSHAQKSLKPHKTHNDGLHLDIFMPVIDDKGQPQFFPTQEETLLGYAVNFDEMGRGEGKYTDLQIDWKGLALLVGQLCAQGGRKVRYILIAKDLYEFLQKGGQKEIWRTLPKKCLQKVQPIPVLKDYSFAGQQISVDHDDHIHVAFQ